ncbi:hypothetical protein CDG77_06705 [Nostoc sp. 'Peltigera membranacea cyanobiont' 213]|uniref:DUF2330 domain-containing protein n=1 Tax=unclassified Nostoc TaxID=2593658 RepID=UPI000B951219|nr:MULTISPECIES: DUF2330 domain-containing protein [unclassified Nostoc]AVH62213.1 protein of unknown function DUF2330 [Nostoc sp. 'Peltigera membranacea cyanobiont' N6]OYD98333.1 hypothetical protein CDG77_06705 [Nostoc sp. 'Peltigera membranacea cyanobiont' 213]
MRFFRLLTPLLLAIVAVLCFAPAAWAFCGFYVAKADTKLYNKASQVVIARDGDRTVLTMANDFQGEVKDFAMVVPVPTVLQKEQVRVTEPKIIERLDAFSAPRLVEYFDSDPCAPVYPQELSVPAPAAARSEAEGARGDRSLGVTIEARFNVGEYDILILSAKESGGLETWLKRNGYKIPRGAKELLKPYIRSSMKFFVAKVNLDKFEQSGYQFLRPLQISYQSPKFMLPIRLGMINATTEQDLIIYILSPQGQAEITNYRTVKIPSDANVPLFVKDKFGEFYKSMFQTAYTKEDRKVGFLEYAWDMGSCDPCSADPLSQEELKQAGVFWLDDNSGSNVPVSPSFRRPSPTSSVFISRLHVRYTRDKFPEDLIFQQTANSESFQGRYVLQHPFQGELKCQAGREYKRSLPKRFEQEAQTLAKLTNWNIQDIRNKMKLSVGNLTYSWWENFFSWLGLY